jgi:hypothetical protein
MSSAIDFKDFENSSSRKLSSVEEEPNQIIIVENLDKDAREITKMGKSTKWKPYLNSKTVEFDLDSISVG